MPLFNSTHTLLLAVLPSPSLEEMRENKALLPIIAISNCNEASFLGW
jgi:hypothetical protein